MLRKVKVSLKNEENIRFSVSEVILVIRKGHFGQGKSRMNKDIKVFEEVDLGKGGEGALETKMGPVGG